MQQLHDRAQQYLDGLISAREFLGFVIGIVADSWEAPEEARDEKQQTMATNLANRLVQP